MTAGAYYAPDSAKESSARAAAERVARFRMPGIGSGSGAVDAATTLLTAQQLRDSRLGAVVSHHREDFDIDERSLLIGASVLLRLAEGLAPAAAPVAAAPAAAASWVPK